METKQTDNSFIRSRTGLVISVLGLGLGICGAIFSVAVGDYASMMPFLAVISLGAFLVTMQFAGSKN